MVTESATASHRVRWSLLWGLLGVVILTAGWLIYAQVRSDPPEPQTPLGPTILRKCTNCGQVFEDSAGEAKRKGYLDLEETSLTAEGTLCPACGRHAVELAEKCPDDGTIFVPDTSRGPLGKAAGCPKCGWNPFPQLR